MSWPVLFAVAVIFSWILAVVTLCANLVVLWTQIWPYVVRLAHIAKYSMTTAVSCTTLLWRSPTLAVRLAKLWMTLQMRKWQNADTAPRTAASPTSTSELLSGEA